MKPELKFPESDLQPDQLRSSLLRLGEFAAQFNLEDLGDSALAAAKRVLFDSFVVMIAGGRLAESQRLRKSFPLSCGQATIFGDGQTTGVVDASWLNGISIVSLELDEGNKYIRGHASAHVLPACVALAESRGSSGTDFMTAFVVGHEIGSRFGAAVHLHPGVHPHGNWGTSGAAAACSRLLGATAHQISVSIDNAGGLAMSTPFLVATEGMPVRNAWIGASNVAGIWAGSLALSDEEGVVVGVANESLGRLLGTIDLPKLTEGLGEAYFVETGYFKRHASCSYTHPPADAAIEVFNQHGPVTPEMVKSITVETHHLASGLTATTWPTRMAAMFSIPYVVATALQEGSCRPEHFDTKSRFSLSRVSLANKVKVINDEEIDRRLPDFRAARLRIDWSSGSQSTLEVDNPIGDADFLPLRERELSEKAVMLLGQERAERVTEVIENLFSAESVTPIIAELREVAFSGLNERLP